jgi:hypothetical protein
VARVFNDDGTGVRGNLMAVVRAILTDYEALEPRGNDDQEAIYGKVREPLLRSTAFARAAGVHRGEKGLLDSKGHEQLRGLKQMPLNSPSVFNFYRPGFAPQDTYFVSGEMVAPELQITDEVSNLAYIRFITGWIYNGIPSKKLNYADWLNLNGDPEQLQARAELLLAPGRFTPERRLLIVNELKAIQNGLPHLRNLARIRTALMLTSISQEHIIQK